MVGVLLGRWRVVSYRATMDIASDRPARDGHVYTFKR